MNKAVYPNPIPKHLRYLPEWKLRLLFIQTTIGGKHE